MDKIPPEHLSTKTQSTAKLAPPSPVKKIVALGIPIAALLLAIFLVKLAFPLKSIRPKLTPSFSYQKKAQILLRDDQGLGPLAIDIDPSGEFAYVTVPKGDCFSSESAGTESLIGVIRLSDNQLIQTIRLPNWVLDVKVTSDGKFLYITNSFEDRITVFDLASSKVVTTIPVGPNPTTADTTTCRTDFNYKPQFLVFSPQGNLAYTSNAKGGTVSVIDVTNHRFLEQILVAPVPPTDPAQAPTVLLWGIVHHPWKNLLYLGDKIGGKVLVVDTQKKKVVNEIKPNQGGFTPLGLAIDPKEEHLYVADARSRQVLVFDTLTQRLRNTLSFTEADGEPEWITFDQEGQLALITHFGTSKISVVDVANQKILGSFQGENSPFMAVFSPQTSQILTTNREGRTVEIFERER